MLLLLKIKKVVFRVPVKAEVPFIIKSGQQRDYVIGNLLKKKSKGM